MSFGDLTTRPFENIGRETPADKAKSLSDEAIKTKRDTFGEWPTRHGNLHCLFRPTGRVEITWRDRGGIKEGWFMKDWTIATTVRKFEDLLAS